MFRALDAIRKPRENHQAPGPLNRKSAATPFAFLIENRVSGSEAAPVFPPSVDIFPSTSTFFRRRDSQVPLFTQRLFGRGFPKTESSNHKRLAENPVDIWVAVWVAVFPKNRRNQMFLNDSNNRKMKPPRNHLFVDAVFPGWCGAESGPGDYGQGKGQYIGNAWRQSLRVDCHLLCYLIGSPSSRQSTLQTRIAA
jgi:hypothetical protein